MGNKSAVAMPFARRLQSGMGLLLLVGVAINALQDENTLDNAAEFPAYANPQMETQALQAKSDYVASQGRIAANYKRAMSPSAKAAAAKPDQATVKKDERLIQMMDAEFATDIKKDGGSRV